MPIVGNLSEFPLPEVLLLIGTRTGCLRLYNGGEFTDVEVDLSKGQAHNLRIEGNLVTDAAQIVAELSFVIEAGDGMFEFTVKPIVSVRPEEAMPVNELVMSLVLHVDEKLAKQRAVLAPELFYVLNQPAPEVALDRNLNLFLQQGLHLLAGGVRSEDLAEYMGIAEEMTRLNLYKLYEAGLVRLVETSDIESLRRAMVGEEIAQKNDEYLFAAEASDLIRRSGKLLKLPPVNSN